MGLLDGLVAVVSGSTSGIGRAIAERFAAEGAGVVLNSVRSVDAGKALAAALPDAVYGQADVSVETEARFLVDAALDRWGRLDIVVNNAGAAVMLDHRDLDGSPTTCGPWLHHGPGPRGRRRHAVPRPPLTPPAPAERADAILGAWLTTLRGTGPSIRR